MDNPYVAIGSVLAVGLLILLNYWIGGWRKARLANDHEARARYHEDYWHDKLGDVLLDKCGRTALLALMDSSEIGLVHAMGDKYITRRIDRGSLESISLTDGRALVIRLNDFSLPQVTLILDKKADRTMWLTRLATLSGKEETA